MNNFFQRLTLGSFLGAIFSFVIYLSKDAAFQPLFLIVLLAMISLALWEYYSISKEMGSEPLSVIGILGSICYTLVLYFTVGHPELYELPYMTFGLVLFSAFLSYFFSGVSPFANLALTMFGLVYLTVPLSFMIPIDLLHGPFWVFYLILVTKINDVGAYVVGKQWGRYKLAPVISPKKTWEGALGGFILGVFTSYALHKIHYSYYETGLFASSLQSLWFGGLMSIVAQIGDLSESLLKRDSGVKDSNKIPGLGGVLDMVDSLVFTTPLLYFFLKTIGGV